MTKMHIIAKKIVEIILELTAISHHPNPHS